MASRLVLDAHGRLCAQITAPGTLQEVGQRFVLLGNDLPTGETGIRWLGRSRHSRPPTLHEQQTAHLKYPQPKSEPAHEPDDLIHRAA